MESNDWKKQVLEILVHIKHGQPEPRAHPIIPVWDGDEHAGHLRVLTTADLADDRVLGLLAAWRHKHEHWFNAQFEVTHEGTRRWLDKAVLETPDRVLFLLEDGSGQPVGHMGFFRFNFSERHCEVDNVVRGEDGAPGLMTHALHALMLWGLATLQPREYRLQTLMENKRAVALYERCGFVRTETIPLARKESPGRVDWIESPGLAAAQRHDLRMRWAPPIWPPAEAGTKI